MNSAFGSASIRIPAAVAPLCSPQASITWGSLTETQTIASTPFARSASATRMKLGRCWVEQSPVKAPGSPKSATRRPAKSAALSTGLIPSTPFSRKVASGSLSPGAIVIGTSSFRGLQTSAADI